MFNCYSVIVADIGMTFLSRKTGIDNLLADRWFLFSSMMFETAPNSLTLSTLVQGA